MKRFLAAIFLILCGSIPAYGQSVGLRGQVQTTTGQAVSGAQVTACTYSSGNYNSAGQYNGPIPCSPALPTFYDPGLTFPISTLLSDGQGNFFFYVASASPNQYTVTISAPGRIQPYGYSIILGGGGSGGGGSPAGSTGDIQDNGGGGNFGVAAAHDTGTQFQITESGCNSGPRPWIDVTCPPYNAKGDAVTDDTAAIQSAITASCATTISGQSQHPVVFFPPGTYIILQPQSGTASPLNDSCGIELRGEGGTVPQFALNPVPLITVSSGATPNGAAAISFSNGATINGVTIDHLGILGYNQAIAIFQGSNIHLTNSVFRAQVTGKADNTPLFEQNTLWLFLDHNNLGFQNANPATFQNLYDIEMIGGTNALGDTTYLQYITNNVMFGGGVLYDQRAVLLGPIPAILVFRDDSVEDNANAFFTAMSSNGNPISMFGLTFDNILSPDYLGTPQPLFNWNMNAFVGGITVHHAQGSNNIAILQSQGTVGTYDIDGCQIFCSNQAVDASGNPVGGGYAQTTGGMDFVALSTSNRLVSNYTQPAAGTMPVGLPIRMFKAGASGQFSCNGLDPIGLLFGDCLSNGYTGQITEAIQNTLDVGFSTTLPPTGVGVSAIAGGTLTNGTYYYFVSPEFSAGGCGGAFIGAPSLISAGATTTTGNNQVTVTWTLPAAAPQTLAGFCVFRGVVANSYGTQTGIYVAGASTTTVTDTGSNFGTVGDSTIVNHMQAFHRFTPTSLSVNGSINGYTDTGTANTIVVTTPLPMTKIPPGTPLDIKVANNNTGATTINLDGIGATSVTKQNGVALVSGDLCVNHQYEFQFNGTTWDLTSPSCSAPISGVSSVSGDSGSIITNSGSTGAVTLVFGTENAHTVLAGPTSGAAATPTFQTAPNIAVTNMTGTGSFNTSGNAGTATSAGTLGACLEAGAGDICYYTGSAWAVLTGNGSGTQYLQETSVGVPSWTVPSGAGTVTHTAGALTSGQPVIGNGTADVKVGPINLAGGSSFVTGALPIANLASDSLTLNGQTVTLGGTGTIPIQTNGGSNSSQNGVNFTTSTANTCGTTITPTNASGIIEKEEATGTVNTTCGGTGTSSPTAHFVPVAEGSSAFNFVTPGPTTGTCYLSNGLAADPSFQTCPGFSNVMTTLGDTIYGGASGTPTRLPGPTGPNNVPQFYVNTPSGGAAQAEAWTTAGLVVRASTCPTNADAIVATDRANAITETDASACAVSIAQAGTTGFAGNFVVALQNLGAGAVTVTPTTSTIDGNATLVLNQGDSCTIESDNTNYFSRCFSTLLTAGTNVTFTRTAHGLTVNSTIGGGSVTSIATTSPITGGTITATGTLGCATCLVATVNPSTGLLRVAGSTQTATGAELSGDATTSGSNAVTVTGVNGATVTGTNGDLVLFGASNHLTDGGTAIPNGFTATTQAAGDATAKVATDAFVAGVNPAVAVLAASTSSQTGTYSNGTGGIGATFTITATGTYTLDGITINAIGQRVLLKNQSSAFQNGVYTATVVGTTGVSPVFTRATDYNQPSDINSTGAIPVTSGTVNTTTTWVITSTVTTVGTDSLTYAQFSVNPANVVQAVSPGAGLCHFAGSTQTCTSSAVVGADMTNATVTATQLAAQYSKGSCTELWGGSGTSFALTAGDDAIADNSCYNDSGVTRTITAVKARSDNASNTTTVNPTFGSAGTGTTICSGALTAGNSLAYSSTCTVSNASWTTGTGINPVMGGTLTGTSISMIIEYTY